MGLRNVHKFSFSLDSVGLVLFFFWFGLVKYLRLNIVIAVLHTRFTYRRVFR